MQIQKCVKVLPALNLGKMYTLRGGSIKDGLSLIQLHVVLDTKYFLAGEKRSEKYVFLRQGSI